MTVLITGGAGYIRSCMVQYRPVAT